MAHRERLADRPAQSARAASPLSLAPGAVLAGRPAAGPLEPARVLALQRAVGNQAVGRLLAAPRGGEPCIQRKSWIYGNRAGYRFEIVDDEQRYIRARSREEPMVGTIFKKKAPAHSGHLRYSTTRTSLFIEHIETEPENGTGLGPLLILLAARKAKEMGLPTISVLGLRYPEYYARWGFDIETPRARRRQQYIDAGREADIPEVISVEQADTTPDNVIARTDAYVRSLWNDEWEAAERTATDKTRLTEFPRFGDD
jgi:hypothetical protein